MAYPVEYRYTKDHEWIAVEGDRARIGITGHAQSELGDIVFVELPEAGRSLATGDVLTTVESVKSVSELYAPVEGEIIEGNAVRQINALGIGPQGFGGRTTALAVLVEQAPCHIASLPVAVNLACHSHRHGSVTLQGERKRLAD